ncbi:MAG: dethiobiotin synthase [Burkholderiales bacterium]|nr:dethiobiotin synthase [Burkholderiales bacterium]
MKAAWFVTGTDTGVGKTLVAAALLAASVRQGWRAVGMKPVAAGGEPAPGGLRFGDVETLIEAGNVAAPRDWVNPYALAEPIAPHIAARHAGVKLDLAHMARCFRQLAALADVVVVEGAGGFLVPLDEETTLADLALRLELPVVLVVGMRLGCLNHALLTVEAIARRGLVLAGWVANRIDREMAAFPENLATLKQRIPAPLLGVIPFFPQAPDFATLPLRLPSL